MFAGKVCDFMTDYEPSVVQTCLPAISVNTHGVSGMNYHCSVIATECKPLCGGSEATNRFLCRNTSQEGA